MIEHALKYARLRIPVIPIWTMVRRNGRIACACGRPCGRDAGKHPLGHLVSNGALDATTDPETIKRWWAKWPDANVGIRLGSFMALDIDPRNGGDRSLATLQNTHGVLPTTRRVKTGGGGWHIIYRRPDVELAGELGPGIDIKTGNGYIVAPPSLHTSGGRYQTIDDIPPAEAPAWLIDLLRKKPPEYINIAPRRVCNGGSTPYGRAALEREVEIVRNTPPGGGRNKQLNTSAFCLYQLVGGGEVDEADVRQPFIDACYANGLVAHTSLRAVQKTIDSARDGLKFPRARAQP
jgi:Bifunctional DNA primase/polymerase, N-terminal